MQGSRHTPALVAASRGREGRKYILIITSMFMHAIPFLVTCETQHPPAQAAHPNHNE